MAPLPSGTEVAEKAYGILQNKWVLAVSLLVTIGLVVGALAWAISLAVRTSLKFRTVSKDLMRLNQQTIVSSAAYPRMMNGSEWALGFWIYVRDTDEVAEKVVSVPGIMDIVLDSSKMKVVLASDDVAGNEHVIQFLSRRRWVHITVVYKDAQVTLFRDGEIYDIKHVSRPLPSFTSDMRIGTDNSSIDGYISNVAVSNHYPGTREMKQTYARGPTIGNWFMNMLGMRGVGVRSPVYFVE